MKALCTLLAALAVSSFQAQAQYPQIHVVSVDSARLGGLYNFRFPIHNAELLKERLVGHELDIRFDPFLTFSPYPDITPYFTVVYGQTITVYDRTADSVLAEYNTLFKEEECTPTAVYGFSMNAAVFTGDINDPMAERLSREKRFVTRSFTTDEPCFGDDRFIDGAFAMTFDLVVEQWGGWYRADTPTVTVGDADVFPTNSVAGTSYFHLDSVQQKATPLNNGPVAYEVEFLPGGTETMALVFNSHDDPKTATFQVPYLNVRVHNTISYTRPTEGGGTAVVSYPGELPHHVVSDRTAHDTPYPDPRDVPIGMYNLTAYAWINGRSSDNLLSSRPRQAAGPADAPEGPNKGVPVGTQGRYYLSVISEGDTVDFCHVLCAAGTEFVLDFSNKRSRRSAFQWNRADARPTTDFEPGDKVTFRTFGGALGLPMPGAQVRIRIDTVATDVAEAGVQAHGIPVTVVPGPVHDIATVRFTLSRAAHTTLTITDHFGRTVATLVDGRREAGEHTIPFSAGNLANGVYFYRLAAGEYGRTGSFVVAR